MLSSLQLESLSNQVKEVENKALVLETEHRLVSEELSRLVDEKKTLSAKSSVAEKALHFIEASVSSRRNSIKSRVEAVIGEALRTVYGSNYSLRVDYDVKNNRSTVEFNVVKETKEGDIVRGIDGVGGGVADTISLPLKLVVLKSTTLADRVLLTDEPGKHISLDRVERFADFIGLVSQKLGIQVIMCSHHEVMIDHADVVYRVSNNDGASEIERVK